MRLGWGRDDGPFFFSCPGRKPHERCEPGPILLCMGLFSRFCVWAPQCTAEEALRCVRDTRSLARLRGLAGFEDTRLLQINGLGQKVFTTAVGLGDGCRGDPGRRLRWQAELEAVDEELQLGFGVSVAGEQNLASVGGWQMNVDHLDGSEFFERAARGQPRRQRMKATGP